MSNFDSRPETYKHINTVQGIMLKAIQDLQQRQLVHDQSKLVTPEVEVFDEMTPKLKDSTYGSDEYKGFLEQMKIGLAHHYGANSHHPEFAYTNEKWEKITGYEDLYEISTFGRVRSLERTAKRNKQGDITIKEKMLSLQITPKGYFRVQLAKNGQQKNYMVHRLVADAFLPNSKNRPQVNHLNGDKTNNNVTNLEWVTASENLLHAYDSGLRNSSAKYFVHCLELDVITLGITKMERFLRDKGYDRASAGGIYQAMDENGSHLDLTFVGYSISEGNPQSMVNNMSLLDLIEMLVDWLAATKRHNDGDIRKSIEINQARFGYGDEIKRLMLNSLPILE